MAHNICLLPETGCLVVVCGGLWLPVVPPPPTISTCPFTTSASQHVQSSRLIQPIILIPSLFQMECLDLGRLAALRIADQPEAVSATVHDDNGKELAKETIIKYTGTQAYVVLSCLDAKLQGKAIKVADDENLHKLKLISIEVSLLG